MDIKIIIDTNLYFSGYAFDRKILKLVSLLLDQDYYYVYQSPQTFGELNDKFLGGRLAKIAKNFEITRAIKFLNAIEDQSVFENPTSKVNLCRDPRDNMFLELAKEVKAGFIISGDKDLLELKQFENTKILRPSEFIEELKLDLE